MSSNCVHSAEFSTGIKSYGLHIMVIKLGSECRTVFLPSNSPVRKVVGIVHIADDRDTDSPKKIKILCIVCDCVSSAMTKKQKAVDRVKEQLDKLQLQQTDKVDHDSVV